MGHDVYKLCRAENKDADQLGRYCDADLRLSLRKLAHAIYRDFLALKIENYQLKNFDSFLIFAQNIDCGYTLELPRRGGFNEYPQSIFGAKIRKIGIPLHTRVLLYKSGVQWGILFTDMLS